ncbi:hypothetical protein RIF29_32100 [Crotalaria pallida]|uniref:Copper transport protein n=1 Tax=Crotalaria pallida TaxID=3830 RepID=A0AAN9EPZ7_CROPI
MDHVEHMHQMGGMHHGKKRFTRMTFFWGKNSEILFDYWPGEKTGMYVLALVFVFAMSFLVELLSGSGSRFTKPAGSNRFASGLLQTLLHFLRVGFVYLIMLALMSFNVGVFLVAVIGHALGFFFFGSNAFKNTQNDKD